MKTFLLINLFQFPLQLQLTKTTPSYMQVYEQRVNAYKHTYNAQQSAADAWTEVTSWGCARQDMTPAGRQRWRYSGSRWCSWQRVWRPRLTEKQLARCSATTRWPAIVRSTTTRSTTYTTNTRSTGRSTSVMSYYWSTWRRSEVRRLSTLHWMHSRASSRTSAFSVFRATSSDS